MQVLVTGGAGFIGSHVVQQLVQQPALAVTVLVRPTTSLWRLQQLGVVNQVQLVHADLTREEEVACALQQCRPDVLIHLAMIYHPPGSRATAGLEAVNFDSTVCLLREFQGVGGRRFVAAGTCFEYGHHAHTVTEETRCQPTYPYAITKLRATRAIADCCLREGMESIVLRVFAPYGPLEPEGRIIPQLCLASCQGNTLELTPGEQIRDYVHVRDVASAFVRAALHRDLPERNALYNVSSGVGHTLRDLARLIDSHTALPLRLRWGAKPYRADEMMHLVGSNTHLRADLAWHPSIDLSSGLRHTLEWWRTGTFMQRAG
jgi:nucleoside-diphosphate-sugar epimerase